MKQKIYSVAIGPLVDGKPSQVEVVVAFSLAQLAEYYSEVEVLSIQVLPDVPVIL